MNDEASEHVKPTKVALCDVCRGTSLPMVTARNLVCWAPLGGTARGMTARIMKCTSASSASSELFQACGENWCTPC